jgi:hypothetical protein
MMEPGIFIPAGMVTLIVTNIGLIAKEYFIWKRNKKNNKSLPCDDHHTRITVIERNEKARDALIEQIRSENREDHGKLFDRLGIQR